MIISRIILKNWRNFQRVDVPLGERVFLVGPNACGKSNFLDALRFLRDLAKEGGGLQKAVNDRGGISKIRCLSARKESQIGIEVHLAKAAYLPPLWRSALEIKQEQRGKRKPFLSYEKVWKDDQLFLNRPDKKDEEDPERLSQTHLEQINANVKFREINEFFSTVLYLHLVPQLLRHPEAFTGTGLSGDPFGRSFLERITKTPEKTRSSRLTKIEKVLQSVIPKLTNLSYIKDDMGSPHLEVLYEHWRPKAGKQREDQFSDGTLRLIGLFWSLLETDTLLLLEEPELSLHAGIVQKLAGLIARLQQYKKTTNYSQYSQ